MTKLATSLVGSQIEIAPGIYEIVPAPKLEMDVSNTKEDVGVFDLLVAHRNVPDNERHIVANWRQRRDTLRAITTLNSQCIDICCREISQNDRMAAAELWNKIRKGNNGDADINFVLEPYHVAILGLTATANIYEKALVKEARAHPLWENWGKDIRGIGELSLAGIIGEAGRSISCYRSVSALWKRFGLAVVNGERQRHGRTKDEMVLHGYHPQRRAFAYQLSTNLIRCQHSDGPYRELYEVRKQYELDRGVTQSHANNRALRYMTKDLLRSLWVAADALES